MWVVILSLRVISGEFKGRKLYSVRGLSTRPSAERLREAVFNILSPRIRHANFLDMFAGTGAFGIEALSRGAHSAVFIEKSPSALTIIHKNVELCGITNRTKIIRWDAIKNLNCIKNIIPPFDIVFMDPPYEQNLIEPAIGNLLSTHSLIPNALIIIEHSIHETILQRFQQIMLIDQRKYGKSLVSFFKYDMTCQAL